MEVNKKLLHLLKVVKSKGWILRYIKKYLSLRLHMVLQEKQNTVHYNYNCLDCNDATNTQVFASGKPHLKSETLRKMLQLPKHLISYQCCLLPPMDLWIGCNHDLCITWLNAQSGFLPILWLFFSLSFGYCSIAAFLLLFDRRTVHALGFLVVVKKGS